VFSVWHHVFLVPDDFLGEVVIPLSGLNEINSNQDIDDMPAVMMPLRRPKEPRDGPYRVRFKNNQKISLTCAMK